MSSKTVYTTNYTIQCPTCAKSMLLKNWKTHCQQMHTMSQTAIETKYNELKKDVEQIKSKIVTPNMIMTVEKPSPLATNTLFSMKKFALAKPTNLEALVVDVDNQMNHLVSTSNDIEPAPISLDIHADINGVGILIHFFFGKRILGRHNFCV
jgi:lipopolysaccharide biosynthesis glycosyltransferase